MNKYVAEPLGFWALIRECLAGFPRIFEYAWYLILGILVLAVITAAVIPINLYVGLTIFILMMLAIIFILAITLHLGNTALLGKQPNFQDSLNNAKKRYLTLCGGVVALIAIAIITGVIDFGLIAFGGWSGLPMLFSVIALVFSVFVGLLFYFGLPLLILENQTVWKSFEKSYKLFLVNPWRIAGVLIVIHIITFLVTAFGTVFIPVKQMYIYYIIYSFIIQLIIYPLIISTILVLLHDANLRLEKRIAPRRRGR